MMRLLMCPPASHLATSQSALRQWERLVELLCVAGDVQVERVDLPSESLEQAFAGNTALICGNLAIMSSVRRRSERSLCRSWLAARGYATTALEQAPFGGACDALFDRVRPYLYVGYGGRTERSAAIALSELTDARVIPLRLIDERFPHLDRALCPLGSGHVMFYPAASSARSRNSFARGSSSPAIGSSRPISPNLRDWEGRRAAWRCGSTTGPPVEPPRRNPRGPIDGSPRPMVRFRGYLRGIETGGKQFVVS